MRAPAGALSQMIRLSDGVREGGVEPPRPFGHTDLNRARLPIPPLARRGRAQTSLRSSRVAGGRRRSGVARYHQSTVPRVPGRRRRDGPGRNARRCRGSAAALRARLEGLVNGAFARAFRPRSSRSRSPPRCSARLDDKAAIVGAGGTLVPNDFIVELERPRLRAARRVRRPLPPSSATWSASTPTSRATPSSGRSTSRSSRTTSSTTGCSACAAASRRVTRCATGLQPGTRRAASGAARLVDRAADARTPV